MATFNALREIERLAATDREPFTFVGADGSEYRLPNHGLLSPRQVQRIAEGDDTIAEEIGLEREALDAMLELPNAVGTKLAESWAEHGQGNGSRPYVQIQNDGPHSPETSQSRD